MSEQPGVGPILVGIDGSESSHEALRAGARLAQALDAPLEVVMCWQDPMMYGMPYQQGFGYIPELDPELFRAEAQQGLEASLTEVFGSDRPHNLSTKVLRGRPAKLLVEESQNAQMLVVGRRGLGGVVGMVLGSVSTAVVSQAKCSVLVVRN